MIRDKFALRKSSIFVGAAMGSGVVLCTILVIFRLDDRLVHERASLRRGSELTAFATMCGVESAHNNHLIGIVVIRAKLSDLSG